MNIKNRICLINEECLQQSSSGFSQTPSHSLITVIRVRFHKGRGSLTRIDPWSRSQAAEMNARPPLSRPYREPVSPSTRNHLISIRQ